MRTQSMQTRRRFILGKTIIGIDPAKGKHQAALLDPDGLPIGKSFSFATTYKGFHDTLWRHLQKQGLDYGSDQIVFAVETSCALWQTLVFYLHTQAYQVVLVSPLSTHHARPSMSRDFSRTDAKDPYLIAKLAWQGSFRRYRRYDEEIEARHALAISYDKLRKTIQQNYARLRALVERVFPELLKVLNLDTKTARYLLGRYLLPEEFLRLDLEAETKALEKVSRSQHGQETLLRIQALARRTIGLACPPSVARAERLALESWLTLIEALEAQIAQVTDELIQLARKTPYFAPLVSLKGVSDLLAALFIAEIRQPGAFTHYKQIEKMAGFDLYVCDSGQYKGRRRITHLGNPRLRWVLYRMVEETTRYVPEVRCKYLRRQLEHPNRQKNLVASLPKLLELVMVLIEEQRQYQQRAEASEEVARLEAALEKRRQRRRQRQGTRGKQAA